MTSLTFLLWRQFHQAHQMAVYNVTWNPFHANVFATCSADWTVKIWDQTRAEPAFIFDLGNSVYFILFLPPPSTTITSLLVVALFLYMVLCSKFLNFLTSALVPSTFPFGVITLVVNWLSHTLAVNLPILLQHSNMTSLTVINTVLSCMVQVEDVAWAPYSSTVLAAITSDGKVCSHKNT